MSGQRCDIPDRFCFFCEVDIANRKNKRKKNKKPVHLSNDIRINI